MEQPNMSQVAPTPLQQAMNRPVSRLTSTGDMSTIMPDGGGVAQTSVPLIQDLARGRVLNPINPMQDMGQPMPVSEAMQAGRARQAAQQPQATPDVMGMEKLAADASRAVQAGAAESTDPSIMNSVKSYFGSRENMLRLAMAFNTMRLQPDQALTAALSRQLEGIEKSKTTTKTQKYVVEWLKANGYEKYVPLAMQDPKMAAEIAKQIAQKELKPDVALSYSEPKIDQETGQMFVVETNPNTQTTRRIDVEGAEGLTMEAKKSIEVNSAVEQSDMEEALRRGTEMYSKATALDAQMSKYQEAIDAIDRGAKTTWFTNWFPTMTEATAYFQSLAYSLGIDIVNSATFGALSESELKLALATALPAGLKTDEDMRAYIQRKIAAQRKLRDQLYSDARKLASGGVRYSQFILERTGAKLGDSGKRASGTQPTTQPAPQGVTVIRFDRNGNLIQ